MTRRYVAPRSLWELTAPAIASDPLDTSRHDTIIVGAGLTGLTTAVLLARAGQRVTVLEGRTVGAATTGNTTGKLSLLQGSVFSDLRSHAGDEVLAAYAEANREGQAWLLRQLAEYGVDVARRPAFTYAPSAADRPALEAEFAAATTVGIAPEWAAETGLPFETAGALKLDDQAQLQPLVVLTELARELRERGGTIVTHTPVREVHDRGGYVEIVSDHGPLVADCCVLATGTPILDRGLFFAKLEPSRSYVAAYRVPNSRLPHGMYLSAGVSRSLRTAEAPSDDGTPAEGTAGEVLVVGGGAHVTGRGDGAAALQGIDDWVRAVFPDAMRVTWWAAQDYRSHTRVPYAGLLPRGGDRIYTATGFNKWGMTNAVAAALTITADMLGGKLEWARVLREHALSIPTVRDAFRANAEVAGHLASGWVRAETSETVTEGKTASTETTPETVPSDHPPTSADARSADLDEGEGAMMRDGLKPVGVARVEGRLCKVSGVCTHLGGVLAWNAAERSWDCPLHGSRFAADGKRLEGPATADLETQA